MQNTTNSAFLCNPIICNTFLYMSWQWCGMAVAAPDDRVTSEEAVVGRFLSNLGDTDVYVRPSVNTTVQFGLSLAGILDMNEDTGTFRGLYWLQEVRYTNTTPKCRTVHVVFTQRQEGQKCNFLFEKFKT